MRLTISILSVFVFVAGLVGCGGDSSESGDNGGPDLNWGLDLGGGDSGGVDADVLTPDPDQEGDTLLPDGTILPDTVEPQPEPFFPAAELGIRILSPAPLAWTERAGGGAVVRGIVLGKAKSVTWSSDKGGAGPAEGSPYFTTGLIQLMPGDNTITVTAQNELESVSDSITITYNIGFGFGELKIIPGGIFTNQDTSLRFALVMDTFQNYKNDSLTVCECTPQGVCLGSPFKLADDGNTASTGDEVDGDSIFSAKKSYKKSTPGPLCFRAGATVEANPPYAASSAVYCIDVVDLYTADQCQANSNVLKEARAKYSAAYNQGGVGPAAQAALEYLQSAPGVAQAGTSTGGYGVWVRFQNGILGALDTSPVGNRGGETQEEGFLESGLLGAVTEVQVLTESRRVLALAPFRSMFGDFDEAVYLADLLSKSSCPPFRIDGPYADGHAGLAHFRSLSEYGIAIITGHGDSYFRDVPAEIKKQLGWRHMGSQEVIWTGEGVDCTAMAPAIKTCTKQVDCPKGTECIITEYQGGLGSSVSGICIDFKQLDLRRGNLVLGAERYGVLPSHIEQYMGEGLPQSLIYLGTCRSLWNGSLATAFLAAGAATVLGYNGYVTSDYAYFTGRGVIAAMLQEQKLSGVAMPAGNDQDPANAGTRLTLLGSSFLNLFHSDLINAGFETGDLTGWFKNGDGRVVSQLGNTGASDGKYMALMSTGLGFTQQTGGIEQDFCIPSESEEARFYWKFFSEEFKEFCGTTYQDTFEAILESNDGQITMVDTWVDALCPSSECLGCGTQYVGLVQSSISFDQGDVWNTTWQTIKKDVRAMAGKGPVTLRFFTGDVGDSIYDTAVLIDGLVID